MMSGSIGVETRSDGRIGFWFDVVLVKQDLNDYSIQIHENLKGKRILVVDGNELNLRILSTLLNSWNCQCEEVSDGLAALNELKSAAQKGEPFDAVIIDKIVPGLDGESLAERIREVESIKNTVLILMTSFGRRGDASRFEKQGFAAYLTKPIRQSQLYDCLAIVLNREAREGGSHRRIMTRHSIAEARRGKITILVW